jgi:predicted DCC family thiol-disulfide oxidoreductase YuxK
MNAAHDASRSHTGERGSAAALDPSRHWIVWDGACGFCRRAVEWALAHDTHGLFRAIPYQDAPSPPMTAELRAACSRAVHVRTIDGRWLRGARACLFVLERIGWPHLARLARVPPLVWIVEAGYRLVAGHRAFFSRLFKRRAV